MRKKQYPDKVRKPRRKNKPVAVARYDDHDGTDFHKHVMIKDKDMQYPIRFKGKPKECLTNAIEDFMKNYQKYINQYLSNFD